MKYNPRCDTFYLNSGRWNRISYQCIAVAVGGERHSYVYPPFDSEPTCAAVEAEVNITIPYKVCLTQMADKIALRVISH